MSLRICGVDELACNDAVRDLSLELLSLCDRALHSFSAFCENEFSTVCLDELSSLNAHGLRHRDDEAVTLCSRYGCKTYTCVAAGGLYDDTAFLKSAGCFSVFDDRLCDTVLNASCRIEVFKLGYELCFKAKSLFEMCELKQRCLTDKLVCRCIDLSHNYSSRMTAKSNYISVDL